MKKILLSVIVLLSVSSCCNSGKHKPQFLFVESGKNATFDGKILKIKNVEKHLIYFSDKPYRVSGHISQEKFMALWNKKEQNNSLSLLDKAPFIKKSPNTAVSYYDKNGKPDVAIIEVSNLKIGKDLVAEIKVLNGSLPTSIHEVALFIDGLVN